ncbi:DUF6586 family protein [Pseudomonas typographi]|uniref:DUF6586 family protein n=1 Tax=Pseudomonas typographi TaxID=2715964 RepID=UPI0016863DA8|nr:DUF6586 family protein [Pseudomonas typographi]MBD1553221.1 PasA protein [Pseudomonas typographi]
MAHERYTRTNQKLYFAGLALEALGKAEEGAAMNAQALAQAGREAVLFHLYGAMLGLCHEIAGFYRLADSNAPRAQVYLTRQTLEAAPNPELAELVELAQQPETWLAQLLAAFEGLFQPPREAPAKAKHDVTTPLIQALNLDEQEPAVLQVQTLEQWRQQLKALAIRFREGLSEC